MTPQYSLLYAIAWINSVVGIIAGVLAGAYVTVHPSWLTGDVAATCTVLVLVSAALAPVLPPITRTPAKRETKYLEAMAGILPDDLARKHNVPPV